jgi:hypothetical protein
MRSARLLGFLGVLVVPSLSAAQEKNPFIDSWFWGAKGGMAFLHTGTEARTDAWSIGAEWLITRTKFGLYIGLDQAYFGCIPSELETCDSDNRVLSTVNDAPTRGVQRRVDIQDMRRLSASMYFFPKSFGNSVAIRPYAGLGYSFNFVVRAQSDGNQFASAEARDTVLSRIESAKTRSSFILTTGVQFNYKRIAPFIQAIAMPTQGKRRDFLINGSGFTYYVEAGLRFNVGTAIERLK